MSVFDDVVVLEFDEYPDLEVRMRVSIPLRDYLAATDMFDDSEGRLTPSEWLNKIAEYVDRYRISWTLEGEALDQPGSLLIGIFRSWLRAIASVPSPLARRFSGGEPSEDQTNDPSTSDEPSSSETS